MIKKHLNVIKTSSYYYLNAMFSFVQLYLIYIVTNDPTINGLWLTILSIVSLLILLDFGLGNTLRNLIGNLIDKNDSQKISMYFSTGIFSFLIIFSIVVTIMIFLVDIFNWNYFLNVSNEEISEEKLRILLIFIVIMSMLKIFMNIFNAVYDANFLNYYSGKILFIGNVLSCILLYVQYLFQNESIFIIALSVMFSPIFVSIIFFFSFCKNKNEYIPMIKKATFNKKTLLKIYGLGIRFFILQFFFLVFFSSGNIIISKYLTPANVVEYQYIFKIFSIVTLGFNAILASTWTFITRQYELNNYNEINKRVENAKKIFYFLTIFSILISFGIKYTLNLFFDDLIVYDKTIFFILLFTISYMWTNLYQTVCNGLYLINVQLLVYGIGAILNIPLSILLIEYFSFGAEAIAISGIICLVPAMIILPFSYRKKIDNGFQIYNAK